MGGHISQEDCERAQEVVQQALSVFSQEFSSAHQRTLMRHVILSAAAEAEAAAAPAAAAAALSQPPRGAGKEAGGAAAQAQAQGRQQARRQSAVEDGFSPGGLLASNSYTGEFGGRGSVSSLQRGVVRQSSRQSTTTDTDPGSEVDGKAPAQQQQQQQQHAVEQKEAEERVHVSPHRAMRANSNANSHMMMLHAHHHLASSGASLLGANSDDASTGDVEDMKLVLPPDPTVPLKSGSLVKQGAKRKSWLTRYFVAHNKAGNYEVEYYNHRGGKLKGRINCSAYRVDRMTSAEEILHESVRAKHGNHSVVLRPVDRRRRTWFLIAESAEDRRAWEHVFRTACWRSQPERLPEPLLREAFRTAFQRTRVLLGVYSWWSYDMPEDELLASLVTALVRAEIFPHGEREAPHHVTNMFFRATVHTPVSATWHGAVTAARTGQPSLRVTMQSMVDVLHTAQTNLHAHILSVIGPTVVPALSAAGANNVLPVCNAIIAPLTSCFISTYEGLALDLRERADRVEGQPETLDDEVAAGMAVASSCTIGPRANAIRRLEQLCNVILKREECASRLNDCMNAYTIFNECMADLESFSQMAYYTWMIRSRKERRKLAEEEADDQRTIAAAVAAAASSVLNDAVDDLKVWVRRRMHAISIGLLQPALVQDIIPPALEQAEPLRKSIPEEVAAFLVFPAEVQHVVYELTDSSVLRDLEAPLLEQTERLDQLRHPRPVSAALGSMPRAEAAALDADEEDI